MQVPLKFMYNHVMTICRKFTLFERRALL